MEYFFNNPTHGEYPLQGYKKAQRNPAMFKLTFVYTIKASNNKHFHTETAMYASLHCLLVNFMPLCTLINERIN